MPKDIINAQLYCNYDANGREN